MFEVLIISFILLIGIIIQIWDINDVIMILLFTILVSIFVF